MRTNSARPRWWGGVGAAVTVLALMAAILGLVLVQSSLRAAGTFVPEVGIDISDDGSSVNADLTTTFNIPGTDYNYRKFYSFTPSEFFLATPDVPIGAKVGHITATATLGLVNGPCNASLSPGFDLFWASVNTSDTVIFSDQFKDGNGDGLHDGIDLYPDFINRILPGLTPVERMYGDTSISGQNVSISIVVFGAGALPGFPATLGRPSVTILNNIGDPASEATPFEAISDFCTPLLTTIDFYGLSQDNPATAANDAGFEVRRNPSCGDTYTFSWYAESMLDAEGDGIESYIDTCPLDVNVDNSPKVDVGPDGDGIDSSCESAMRASDPNWLPTDPCWPGVPDCPGPFCPKSDCDGDFFYNRGDNCPLVANQNQLDADSDDIGDACDPNPNTPDGVPVVLTPTDLSVDVEISGTACGEATATPTPTPTATPTATGTVTATVTGTVTATGTATPTAVVGEGCSPVIPGTYNGLVRLNGVPAAAGYEVTAEIDGTEWGSAIVSGGRYALDIPEKLPSAEPCFAGGTITFKINGGTCTPTEEWSSGLHDVDLSCAPAATPTVPPGTPTTPPTTPAPATPTPAKPPPTGGGGLGGDPSLPLWAMALVGWAGLMALAGLGTLATRIVKR